MVYNIIAIMLAGLSGLMILAAARSLFSKTWFLGWLRGSIGLALFGISFVAIMLAWDIHGYQVLGRDQVLAHVSFSQNGEQRFIATIAEPSGRERKINIEGDLWQVDARLIKWSNLMSRAGLASGFRLQSVSGRYFTLEHEQSREKSLAQLNEKDSPIDSWHVIEKAGKRLPWVEAIYANTSYLPMSDGALYAVTLSTTGLVSRPLNERAEEAALNWN